MPGSVGGIARGNSRAVETSVRREDFKQRNFRVAMALVGWIALLSIASLIVIWVRN